MSIRLLPGVHAPHRKNTADCFPQRMPAPAVVTIPMSMNIGAPAKPIVKPGDEVKVGQLIAEAGGFVSSPIHSSVSGKVKKVDEILMSNGQTCQAITQAHIWSSDLEAEDRGPSEHLRWGWGPAEAFSLAGQAQSFHMAG